MKHRKIRTYPPVIVTLLVMLFFAAAATVSIVAEAERQTATQQGAIQQAAIQQTAEQVLAQARPTAGPTEATAAPEVAATPEPEPTYTTAIQSYDWDGEDAQMLMKIAMAEAEGESVEGKALVMLVVLNRAWSDEFPDSIEAVLFQKNQFSPVADGGRYWTTEPNAECAEALALVESGWDESQGALYFESAANEQGWHSRSLEFLFQYGGHKFYR